MEEKYLLLKRKYNELLIPTLFMVISEKICTIIDVFLIGLFINGDYLASINLVTPLLYVTGIFYVLFGQGGSLLSLRAKAELDNEKSDFYFTISILGIIVFTIIYILMIFLFSDNILHLLNTPANIYAGTKNYLNFIIFFYPLNCFIITLSYFIRSDGFPKLPFYAVLIANIFNIIFDVIFLKGFGMGVEGAALASVVGYLISAIYISKYFMDKKRNFQFISLGKLKIKQILHSIKEIIFNTPEVIGKIFFASQILVFTFLCSTYYGVAGLLAFLVYDNSETFVYMFLSGIMKTMTPIVAVFHKEMDYNAVHYIIVRSLKQILIVSVPISIYFFIFPESLINFFNISNTSHINVIVLAIRLTSFGLIGRCLSYLFANYTQAIQQNEIASVITLLEECIISIGGALLLTHQIGGIGIWIAILLSETIPILFYIVAAIYQQKSHKNEIKGLLMLNKSNMNSASIMRDNIEISEDFTMTIKRKFKDDTNFVSSSMIDLCENIFQHNPSIDEIIINIRILKDKVTILFIDDGDLYNPFSNEDLINSPNIKKLSEINCKLDYNNSLGFNKSYLLFD